MMMGPEPISRIFFRSVRLGIVCGGWDGRESPDHVRRKLRIAYGLPPGGPSPRGRLARPGGSGSMSGTCPPPNQESLMRRFGFGFALVGLFAVAAAAQDKDAIEIKIASPKAGQKARVTVEEKTVTKTTFTVGGKTESKDEVKTKSLV